MYSQSVDVTGNHLVAVLCYGLSIPGSSPLLSKTIIYITAGVSLKLHALHHLGYVGTLIFGSPKPTEAHPPKHPTEQINYAMQPLVNSMVSPTLPPPVGRVGLTLTRH